jgi:hypothetical protein
VCQGEQPRPESRYRFKARGIAGQREPDLLEQVVRGRLVAHIALKIAPDAQLMSSVELIECGSVAARVASYESFVVFFRIGHGRIIADATVCLLRLSRVNRSEAQETACDWRIG